ncbi:hypothetical protein [Actinomadura madurae]|nr:hypothetical protein [Actinomadura madurae]MCP9947393.1 hypothetical protein [Actinomadura madurae]MCP9976632.1 hypothetical protein [Actinomadura madurae]
MPLPDPLLHGGRGLRAGGARLVRRDGLLQEVACHFADTAGTTAPR